MSSIETSRIWFLDKEWHLEFDAKTHSLDLICENNIITTVYGGGELLRQRNVQKHLYLPLDKEGRVIERFFGDARPIAELVKEQGDMQ